MVLYANSDGKIVYGVQKVGLALAVVTADAVDTGSKRQVRKLYVAEILHDNPADVIHNANISKILQTVL